ncbi:MAG: murein hydrolase activator EnvC family protein [Candidatus Saccharibacteria bacterium]
MQSFKIRAVIALALIVVITWTTKGSVTVGRWLQPALRYTVKTNYDILGWGQNIFRTADIEESRNVFKPAMRAPCIYSRIVRHFGWVYDPKTKKQEFNSGIVLQVDEQVPVYPVFSGKVADIKLDDDYSEVIIQHGSSLISITRGLQQVYVRKGQEVEEDTELGTVVNLLYFELRSREGPVNPEEYLKRENKV